MKNIRWESRLPKLDPSSLPCYVYPNFLDNINLAAPQHTREKICSNIANYPQH